MPFAFHGWQFPSCVNRRHGTMKIKQAASSCKAPQSNNIGFWIGYEIRGDLSLVFQVSSKQSALIVDHGPLQACGILSPRSTSSSAEPTPREEDWNKNFHSAIFRQGSHPLVPGVRPKGRLLSSSTLLSSNKVRLSDYWAQFSVLEPAECCHDDILLPSSLECRHQSSSLPSPYPHREVRIPTRRRSW